MRETNINFWAIEHRSCYSGWRALQGRQETSFLPLPQKKKCMLNYCKLYEIEISVWTTNQRRVINSKLTNKSPWLKAGSTTDNDNSTMLQWLSCAWNCFGNYTIRSAVPSSPSHMGPGLVIFYFFIFYRQYYLPGWYGTKKLSNGDSTFWKKNLQEPPWGPRGFKYFVGACTLSLVFSPFLPPIPFLPLRRPLSCCIHGFPKNSCRTVEKTLVVCEHASPSYLETSTGSLQSNIHLSPTIDRRGFSSIAHTERKSVHPTNVFLYKELLPISHEKIKF